MDNESGDYMRDSDLKIVSERLKELIKDANLNKQQFAQNCGFSSSTASRYANGDGLPNFDAVVKIADFFNVSLDYLTGRKNVYSTSTFKQCPPFDKWFAHLLETHRITKYSIKKGAEINDERIYSWLNGKSKPSLTNLVRVADFLGFTLDYFVGREN